MNKNNPGNKLALPPETVIFDKYAKAYTINEVIGIGGNSIIYKVTTANSRRELVLKECCPNTAGFIRSNGVVRPENPNDSEAEEYLSRLKRDLANESELGQIISNDTRRIIASWENLEAVEILLNGKTYDATGSFFIFMEKAPNGYFLKDFIEATGLPAPHIVAGIMEQLLMALNPIHERGYLHGDIQTSNFFLTESNPAAGIVGYGQLLDFGNGRKILADGMTEVISEYLFSTPGYWSPEILMSKSKPIRLTQATDIYSAGALMLYLIKGFEFKSALGKKMALQKFKVSPVSYDEAIRRGYRHNAIALLRKILLKALQWKPQDRYQNAAEMLSDIIELKKLVAPPTFKLSPNLSRTVEFVEGSRNRELAILQDDLRKKKNPLFIWGIFGIGKSSLAVEFALRQIDLGIDAYFVHFRNSIKETILNMDFSGYQTLSQSEEDYQTRLKILRDNYAGSLLIIDGFNKPNVDIAELQRENAYKDLIALDMHILFTTNSRPDSVTEELGPLSEEDSLTLFKSITKDEGAAQNPVVRELLREVNYHPQVVSLSAHAISESWNNVSADFLLSNLKSGNLSGVDKVYHQLKFLFNLFQLDDDYRDLLCHTTLLPLDGFDAGTFIASEDNVKKKQLKKLEGASWVRRRNDNKLCIHPLIRLIFKNELAPKDEDCEEFLSALWKKFEFQYPVNTALFKQAAELYENATNNLQDAFGNFAYCAGHCFFVIERLGRAKDYAHKSKKIREKVLSEWDIRLAKSYNDVGALLIYFSEAYNQYLGEYETVSKLFKSAYKHFLSAYAIFSKTAPDNPHFGETYLHLVKFFKTDEAIIFVKGAIDLFRKQPQKLKFKLAGAYSKLGELLKSSGKNAEAIEQIKIAAEIYKSIAPPEGNRDLALAYVSISDIYKVMDNLEDAIEYIERAIQIQEKVLSIGHPEIFHSYQKAAELYKSVECFPYNSHYYFYLRKSNDSFGELRKYYGKKMLENIFLILNGNIELDDKMLAHYNRNLADAYRDIGDYDNAEKYILMSEEKISADSTDATELWLTYFTASQIYRDKKMYETAISYAKKALAVTNPKDSSNLQTCYLQLAMLDNDIKSAAVEK